MTTRAQLCTALSILVATALATAPARSAPQAKAFPPGCWIGTTPYSGTATVGLAKGAVSKGTQQLFLWVGTDEDDNDVYGTLLVKGSATGTLEIAGSALAAEMKLLGNYELRGNAEKVKVSGTYSITGTARGTGQLAGTFPIKVKMPVSGVLVIKTVSANRVTGHFRKAPWSATRRPGALSKNTGKCLTAKAG